MKKLYFVLLIIAAILVGCTKPSELTAEPTAAATPTVSPTCTPSPTPFVNATINLTAKVSFGYGQVKLAYDQKFADEASVSVLLDVYQKNGISVFSSPESGFRFEGWYKNSDCTEIINSNPIFSYKIDETKQGDVNETIYAKFVTCTPIPIPDMSDIVKYVDDDHGTIRAELRGELKSATLYKQNVDESYYWYIFSEEKRPKANNAVAEKVKYNLLKTEADIRSGKIYPNLSGFKLYEAKAFKKEIDVSFEPKFVREGILSGYFKVYYHFYMTKENEDGGKYYAYYYPVSFNLETGEIIKIADLFYNDVDYLQYLKEKALERIHDAEFEGFEVAYLNAGDLYTEERTRFRATMAEWDWLQLISGISENQNFLIYDGVLTLLFDWEEVQIAVRILPTEDFFDKATYHIIHTDSKVLDDSPAEDSLSDYETYYEGREAVPRENVYSLKTKDGVVSFEIDKTLFSNYEIEKMLQDKTSQLYKNIYESNIDGVAYFEQFELDKYIVLMVYTKDSLSLIAKKAVYTIFYKHTFESLPICLVSDKPETFFKPGTDWIEIVANEIFSGAVKNTNKSLYYSSDKDLMKDIIACLKLATGIVLCDDGKIKVRFAEDFFWADLELSYKSIELYLDYYGIDAIYADLRHVSVLGLPIVFTNTDALSF